MAKIFASQTKIKSNKYKFGIQVPTEYSQGLRMLTGCLNWATTIGRFGVHYAAPTMGRYQIVPKQWYLDYVLIIFGYLKHYRNKWIVFDFEEPELLR